LKHHDAAKTIPAQDTKPKSESFDRDKHGIIINLQEEACRILKYSDTSDYSSFIRNYFNRTGLKFSELQINRTDMIGTV
jgi:hypothetical protein